MNLIKFKKTQTEEGNIIDQLGSIIVMVFIFAMILANAAYGSSVQKRLNIDNVAKTYLYIMEQNGYLSEEDETNMTNELASLGVSVVSFEGTTKTQVAYGDRVTLQCKVEFQNPLYSVFENGAVVNLPGFPSTISYNIYSTATSKW